MTANILDGKQLAYRRRMILRKEVDEWYAMGCSRNPGLAVILVGDDPASIIYTERKRLCCEELGFLSRYYHFSSDVAIGEVLELIKQLNADNEIDGILVQLPLPRDWKLDEVLETIDPTKDVDGFHSCNLGKRVWGWPGMISCTPYGIMQLIATTKIDLKGVNAVLVGASSIVGKPLALELLNQGATVTIAHKFTKHLDELVKQAELLVVAVGARCLIPGHWIKKGAIVIDVGINRSADGSICGDVEFIEAARRASWITPVPGGVGPMTVQCLMENTWLAYKNREKKR